MISDDLKDYLHSKFTRNMGSLLFFLWSSKGNFLSHEKFILDILVYMNLLGARAAFPILEQHLKLKNTDEDTIDVPFLYR